MCLPKERAVSQETWLAGAVDDGGGACQWSL